ncbi:MADS-box transcription factor 16 [Platanthera guangdongensis]|uniref:MADS-box transcription factor 16 n=1 Tax=Platanthera guangdongensis TaxID=2320717 RepID=A0ABR2MIC2_9ASPA
MGRGKIGMKKIENPTSRQVTYSKRRLGIMKKAEELTVLCDARVSLVIFSSSGRLADYCSPSTDIKEILGRYQQVTGIDIWNGQYERMQNMLNNLNEINGKLRKEIRRRRGENLEELEIQELRGLEQNLEEALRIVRERKALNFLPTDRCSARRSSRSPLLVAAAPAPVGAPLLRNTSGSLVSHTGLAHVSLETSERDPLR